MSELPPEGYPEGSRRVGVSQSTYPNPCLESSPTPSQLPKPCMRKIQFSKQKIFVLEN